jgi:hypothetical protein
MTFVRNAQTLYLTVSGALKLIAPKSKRKAVDVVVEREEAREMLGGTRHHAPG